MFVEPFGTIPTFSVSMVFILSCLCFIKDKNAKLIKLIIFLSVLGVGFLLGL